jgi:hypothetical protein
LTSNYFTFAFLLFVDPLTFRHIPSTARRVMPAHFRQALSIEPTLLPFFKERLDQHRNIEADQKSPHDATPLAFIGVQFTAQTAQLPSRQWKRPPEICRAADRAQNSLDLKTPQPQFLETIRRLPAL